MAQTLTSTGDRPLLAFPGRRAIPLIVFIAACLVAVLTQIPAPAANASQTSPADCNTLEITLNGSKQATRCLTDNDSVTTATYQRPCYRNADDEPFLAVYWNGPINVDQGLFPTGPALCIRGKGWLNLDGVMGDGRNWNDQASSWWAGCSSGTFDENAGLFPGRQQSFRGGLENWGNFDGRAGRLGNDTLTVVTLDGEC